MNCDFFAMVTKEPISWMRSGGMVGMRITGAEVRFFANILRAWIIFLRDSSFFASPGILFENLCQNCINLQKILLLPTIKKKKRTFFDFFIFTIFRGGVRVAIGYFLHEHGLRFAAVLHCIHVHV